MSTDREPYEEDDLALTQQSNSSNVIDPSVLSDDEIPTIISSRKRKKGRRARVLEDDDIGDEDAEAPRSSESQGEGTSSDLPQDSDVQLCRPSKGVLPKKPKALTSKQSELLDSTLVEFDYHDCMAKKGKKADVHKECREYVDLLEGEAGDMLDAAKELLESREKQWNKFAVDVVEEVDQMNENGKRQFSRAKDIAKERDMLQKKVAKLEASLKTQVETWKLQASEWKKKFTKEVKKTSKLEEEVKNLKAQLEEARLETPTAAATDRILGGKKENISYLEKKQIDLDFHRQKELIDSEKKAKDEDRKLGRKSLRASQLHHSVSMLSSVGALSGTGPGTFSAPGMMNMMVRFIRIF